MRATTCADDLLCRGEWVRTRVERTDSPHTEFCTHSPFNVDQIDFVALNVGDEDLLSAVRP